jgi:uncharacterized protein YndB with AHSA1/START domain
MEKITITALVEGNKNKVWGYYTRPEHIVQWNFADPSWHCPSASNDLKVGGKYVARMEARDGSFGFDFEAVYTEVVPCERLSYGMWGRDVTVTFEEKEGHTLVTVSLDPETENPVEMQRQGWQAILDNFKNHTESN